MPVLTCKCGQPRAAGRTQCPDCLAAYQRVYRRQTKTIAQQVAALADRVRVLESLAHVGAQEGSE